MELEDFKRLLQESIKPELNKLYTERPKLTGRDGDWGWFCREHAFHCYFLAKLAGFDASIKRGDLVGRNQVHGGVALTSVGASADHVWCQINNVVPVDVSANFEFFPGGFPWVDVIFGSSNHGEFVVFYHNTAATFPDHTSSPVDRPWLAYLEKEQVRIADHDLIRDPYSLLSYKPNTNGLGDAFGHDIFNKVTLHLHGIATGRSERLLKNNRDVRGALESIRDQYGHASKIIEGMLG